MRPLRRKKKLVLILTVSVVNKDHDTLVGVGSYNTPRRLKNVVHSREGVGVIVAALALYIVIFLDYIVFIRETRKSHANNDRTDKLISGKVNALRK